MAPDGSPPTIIVKASRMWLSEVKSVSCLVQELLAQQCVEGGDGFKADLEKAAAYTSLRRH
jgi:hypothetical protein